MRSWLYYRWIIWPRIKMKWYRTFGMGNKRMCMKRIWREFEEGVLETVGKYMEVMGKVSETFDKFKKEGENGN